MPITINSVANKYGYPYNSNYTLNPRQFERIIKVLEASRDNLNRAYAVHICIQISDLSFDKTLINTTLTKSIQTDCKTGFGYFYALEKSQDNDGYHIHIMLTFSTGGSHKAFTIVTTATEALKSVDGINSAIAFDRKMKEIDKNKPISKHYFHDLNTELNDAVERYSYLAKIETKDSRELKGVRLTQSKTPKASKTKQKQKIRKRC